MMKIYSTAKVFAEKQSLPKQGHIGDWVLINLEKLTIGEGSQINAGAKIIGGSIFTMGKNSTVGYNTVIATGSDTKEAEAMNDYASSKLRQVVLGEVCIGDRCFIGPNCVIAVSRKHRVIHIGDDSIVLANSYIGKDVKQNTMAWSYYEPHDALEKWEFSRGLWVQAEKERP